MASVSSGTRIPLTIRVFLASPGDVVDERARARKTPEDLQYNPLLRGKIMVETVAWDKPGAGTPMLASKTPQQAIAEGLAKPSECDIVIVIFWSRMGTPLPADYIKHLSLVADPLAPGPGDAQAAEARTEGVTADIFAPQSETE